MGYDAQLAGTQIGRGNVQGNARENSRILMQDYKFLCWNVSLLTYLLTNLKPPDIHFMTCASLV